MAQVSDENEPDELDTALSVSSLALPGPGPIVPVTPPTASPPAPELYFPEWARRDALATGAEQYDFERCETVDATSLRGMTRVSFAQLGALGNQLNRTVNGAICATADCFLRVATAGIGGTVTIGSSGTISCEDPATQTLGTCTLTQGPADATDGHRGFVVVADHIRIDGALALGGLSLVLVASVDIEFTAGGRIESFTTVPAKAAARTAVTETSLPGCTTTCTGPINNPAEPPDCETTCSTYATFRAGNRGADGAPAGTVAMIAPTVKLPSTSTGTQPHVRLVGQGGGAGGDLEHIRCRSSNAACGDDVVARAQPAGSGGGGGAGGKLITITDGFTGEALRFSTAGGVGGAPGARPVLDMMSGSSVVSSRLVSRAASTGTGGSAGWRDDLLAGGVPYDYAFAYARRGADRLQSNGQSYARAIHVPGTGANNTAVARGQLQTLLAAYCHPVGLFVISPPVVILPPRSTVRAPLAPASYLPAGVAPQRTDVCREADARLARVNAGLNWFGLAEHFYMYLRPDVMAGFRNTLVARLDTVRADFNNVANVTDALIQASENQGLEQKRKAEEIAAARFQHIGEVVTVSLARITRNENALDETAQALQFAQDQVTAGLQASPCDFVCALGQFVNVVTAVVQFATGAFNAVSAIKTFVENIDPIFDIGHLITDIGTDLGPLGFPTDSLEQIKLLGAYADQVLGGIPSQNIPGVTGVGGKIKTALEGWRAVDATIGAHPSMAAQWNRLAFANHQTLRELRRALRQVVLGITAVEGFADSGFVDRRGALANLRVMQSLLEERMVLADRTETLIEEHLMALGELKLAQAEWELAQLDRAHAEDQVHKLRCRLGIPDGDCTGIAPGNSARARRDRLCVAGRSMNDTVLLFDFFYQRSKDFVLLADYVPPNNPSHVDRSHDLRRNLLVAADRSAFEAASANAIVDDFLAQLQGTPETGTVTGDFSDARSYARDVVGDLRRTGRARFDIAAECDPTESWSYCNPSLFQGEQANERVVNFDIELGMAPGYRLGCASANGCGSGDAPTDTGFRYRVRYKHDDVATFVDDAVAMTTRSYFFPESYPRQACELAKAISGSSTDCRRVVDFGGRTDYGAPSQHALAVPRNLDAASYTNPDLFGTSARGSWEIDIGDTLAQLNGPSPGDACYAFTATSPLPRSCYPSECLSPCFDAAGARRSSSDATQPRFCSCYDTANALKPAAQLAGRAECVGRPATLTWVRNDVDLAEACRPATTAPTNMEALCRRFKTSAGQLYPNGLPGCCTSDGRLRGDLSASSAQQCEVLGYESDASCRAPDMCLEICGPRCKEFKKALLGFEFRIDWRADN